MGGALPSSDGPTAFRGSGGGGSRYSPELEAARGLAILLVVMLHYVPYYFERDWVVATFGPLAVIPQTGRTGVVLFFVLSAFLLGTPFLREWQGGRSPSLARFCYRRVLRVFPLYYAAVLVAYLWVGDEGAAIRSLLFLNDGLRLQPFSDVWWSLRTEIQFYSLLALSVWLLRRRRTRGWAQAALALLALLHLAYVVPRFFGIGPMVGLGSRGWLYSFAFQWPPFAFGGLAAWLYLTRGDAWARRARRSVWMRRGGGDLALAAVLLALGTALTVIQHQRYMLVLWTYPGWPIVEGVLWAVFVLALLVLPLRGRVLLVNPVMEFLGRISYSLYLVHLPLNQLSSPLRGELRTLVFGIQPPSTLIAAFNFAVIFAMAIALGWLTYRLIERPFLRLKNRFR